MIHVSLNLQATTSFCIVDKVLVETLAQHSTIKASPMLITFQQHENRQSHEAPISLIALPCNIPLINNPMYPSTICM